MKKILFAFTLPIVLFLNCIELQAQDNAYRDYEENRLGINISATPHLVVVNTLRLDIDKQILKTNNWLVGSFSLTRFYDDILWGFKFDKMETYGGSLSYRYYFFCEEKPRLLYTQGGLVAKYTTVNYSGYGWETTYYNGVEALEHVDQYHSDEIVQYGADFKVGCVLKCNRFIFFDFYVGLGIRESDVLSPYTVKSYNGEFLSPAYTGVTPLAGIRFGVNL